MDSIDAQAEALRAFNRLYTSRIGVLGRSLGDTGFSLTEARVLFEIGAAPGVTATALGAALGLDAGYLSRLLAGFAGKGLVARARAATDGRQQLLELTADGAAELDRLQAAARGQARSMLGGLPPAGRARLLAALRAAGEVLENRLPAIEIRDSLPPGGFGRIAALHGAYYAAEWGLNTVFEAEVATELAAFATALPQADSGIWVAMQGAELLGSIAVDGHSDRADSPRLRWVILAVEARGQRLGARLLDAALAFCRTRGFSAVHLWTFAGLAAARALYESRGFRLTAEEADASWGRAVTAQRFDLTF